MAASSPTGVFVLGMHRSGTSATTRLVHLLGVPINVASDWIAPAPDNPKGFWESAKLVALNDELLAALGGSSAYPPALAHEGWEAAAALAPLRARAREAFPALFPSTQWVWKDPRTCLTFPFWRRALAVRPVVVLAYRNPLEVVRSLQARDRMTAAHAVALWERYVTRALDGARGLPAFVSGYEHMMRDPHSWCAEVGAFLAAHGVRTAAAARADVDAFLDGSLRHSAHSPADVGADPEARRLAPLLAFLEDARGPHAAFDPPAEACRESTATEAFFAPPEPQPQPHPRFVLVRAEELIADPRLADAIHAVAGGGEPVTFLLAGGLEPAGALLPGLAEALAARGLDAAGGPDLLATPLPPARLAERAGAILTLREPPPAFAALPRLAPAATAATPA